MLTVLHQNGCECVKSTFQSTILFLLITSLSRGNECQSLVGQLQFHLNRKKWRIYQNWIENMIWSMRECLMNVSAFQRSKWSKAPNAQINNMHAFARVLVLVCSTFYVYFLFELILDLAVNARKSCCFISCCACNQNTFERKHAMFRAYHGNVIYFREMEKSYLQTLKHLMHAKINYKWKCSLNGQKKS